MKWTEEQQKVITLRDRNILVSAAAGSGKTAVLVQRILSKIMDPLRPVDIDRLLIMTFTRAAAGEMRERIERALDTALAEDPDNEHLQRQMMLIHTAQITTIDGFCSYVIRNYFHLIGLDPGYRTADEGELKLLQEDVLKELFEDYYAEGDEKFTAFVECYASGKSDEGLKEHVLDLYNASMSNPWPEEWLDGCVENYHLDPEKGIAGTPWFHYLWEIVDNALKEAEELTESAMEICGETEGPELYLDALKNDLILIRQLRELSVKQDYDEMAQYLQNIKFARLSMALITRGYRIARLASDRFSSALAAGLTSLIAVQTILNLCVVTNLLPSTGIALPFFSYGGTALAVNLGEMGIVLSVSRQAD